jgi:O-antigen/teichoic acid export membrane protein
LDARRLLQTAGAAAVLTITISALSYADALIVKHFMPASEAGFYAAVSLGGKILLFGSSFVPLVLLPKAANRVASGTSPLSTLAAAAAMWGALSLAGLGIFYVGSGAILRTLVGSEFVPAAPLLFDYAIAMALLGGMNLFASYKIALHRFDFVYPFMAVTVLELAAIAVYHPTLRAVIQVLIVGNAVGLASALYRIRAWRTTG